jgi:tetratricopeptide (TPR) repeat protein
MHAWGPDLPSLRAMKADLLILQICDFLNDGDGFYRLHEPSRLLSQLPGVVVIDCHFYHRLLPELLQTADVLILPFLHNWDLFPVLEQRRAAGQVTVFEANDYFYDIHPWNAIGPQWQDRAVQAEYRLYMAHADAVQTSTEELARRWRAWSRQVGVFPNQLTEIPALAEAPQRPLTIGWGGSPGHFADWYHVAPALERWLTAHPDVHLAVMTHEFARPFLQLPAERYHFTPFGSLAEYQRFLPSLDIGLAPLLPTEYNRCRSDVKFLEYAAHGVVFIGADLEPYRTTVRPGQTGLLYRTEHELLHHLDVLYADASRRSRLRTAAHEYVCQERRSVDHIGARLAFYQGLAANRPRGGAVSAEVLACAVQDNRYLQLRPQQPEQTLLAVLKANVAREAVPTLGKLLEQQPRYLAALRQYGRFLNDAGDHAAGLAALRRAWELDRTSAQTQAEMGRSYFGLKDYARARECLETALRINPLFLPGWQYFLRFLALRPSPDGPQWAERAQMAFPENYALALLGARLHTGPEKLVRLHQLLDTYAPSFTTEEEPTAALAFSQAIQEMVGPQLAQPEAAPLLRRAVEVFPQSALLATLLGQALFLTGQAEESRHHLQRALQIRRQAVLYRGEFPNEDGTLHYWQFAEHIHNALERQPGKRS